MNWLRRILVLVLSCMPSVVLAQAAVVSDPTLTITTEMGFTTQAAKLVLQLDELRKQVKQAQAALEQAKSQYQALTGTRNLGVILNNPALRDYLPREWQAVYDGVRVGGYAGLTQTAREIVAANRAFDVCKTKKDADARIACEAAVAKPAQDKAVAMKAFETASKRLEQIGGLMAAINQTRDPKAIAELQARIGAEQAAIQNEQTKLALFQMAAQAEDRLQEQRQRELEARTWSSRKGIVVEPLKFE